MPRHFRLYGAHISNFTGKVRSYLRHKRIPHEEITASYEVYDTLLVPRVGYRMMPVVITPEDETLQDSADILAALEARFPTPSILPTTPRQRLAVHLLEAYGTDWLRIPSMYSRWAYPEQNHDFIVREFGRMYAPTAHPDQQYRIGDEGCSWARSRLPALGVTDRTAPLVAAWIERLYLWPRHGQISPAPSAYRKAHLWRSKPSISAR